MKKHFPKRFPNKERPMAEVPNDKESVAQASTEATEEHGKVEEGDPVVPFHELQTRHSKRA